MELDAMFPAFSIDSMAFVTTSYGGMAASHKYLYLIASLSESRRK
jgi:hypothetical protein